MSNIVKAVFGGFIVFVTTLAAWTYDKVATHEGLISAPGS